MPYKVPKYIRRETKIVWFFSFKQFVYVGVAVAICIFLYFTWGKNNIVPFALVSVFLVGGSFAMAFLKIKGTSLPTYLKNLLSFTLGTKKYLWKKRKRIPKLAKKKPKPKQKPKTEPSLNIVQGSRLKKLSREVRT